MVSDTTRLQEKKGQKEAGRVSLRGQVVRSVEHRVEGAVTTDQEHLSTFHQDMLDVLVNISSTWDITSQHLQRSATSSVYSQPWLGEWSFLDSRNGG